MKLNEIKKVKDFSLILIPAVGETHKKSIVLNFWRILVYFLTAAIAIGLIAFVFFSFTPLKYLIVASDVKLTKQNIEMEMLNKKVLFLTRELENISALNKKLKYAIMLGDSSLFDSIQSKRRSEDINKTEVSPYGGNIFMILNKIFSDTAKVQIKTHPLYFLKPVDNNFITREFNSQKGHMGLDYSAKTGANVYAAAGGYVIYSDFTADDGYMIILMHDDNYISVYKHCSVLTKRVRDRVVQGEVIALSGNTGLNTTGPHLHFEIWKDGQAINPKTVLNNN